MILMDVAMNIPEFYSTIAHLFDLEVNKLERIALIELKELSIMNKDTLSTWNRKGMFIIILAIFLV